MIIKGNPAGNVGFWSKHLLRDDTNARVEVKEISGLLAEDLPSALREMQAMAKQSRSQGNFLYQANINPRQDEHLTPEQWVVAVDALEKNLGLEGHQRVVVEHIKEGRQHYHVIWNRVDADTLKVVDMGGNWPIHEETARQLEQAFDLTPTPTPQSGQEPSLELWEIRAAERSGIDPKALKRELTELWNQADSGQAFAAAIEEHGYIIAKGDRRDFCIIDQAGDAHSLARRLEGVNAKAVREQMADVDREALPTVAQARETQHQREKADRAITPANDPLPAVDKEHGTLPGQDKADNVIGLIEPTKAADFVSPPALLVMDAATGIADTLMNFVGGLSSRATVDNKSTGYIDQLDRIREQRRAKAAVERLADSIERGDHLAASDVLALTHEHLENIRAKGDDYVRSLIESMERARAREIDYGRTRER